MSLRRVVALAVVPLASALIVAVPGMASAGTADNSPGVSTCWKVGLHETCCIINGWLACYPS